MNVLWFVDLNLLYSLTETRWKVANSCVLAKYAMW